jgi:hypothetical protein
VSLSRVTVAFPSKSQKLIDFFFYRIAEIHFQHPWYWQILTIETGLVADGRFVMVLCHHEVCTSCYDIPDKHNKVSALFLMTGLKFHPYYLKVNSQHT